MTSQTLLSLNYTYHVTMGDIHVQSLLGSGTQGEVYKITLNGTPYALKIYFPNQVHDDLIESISLLIEKGSPTKHFIWPIYQVEIDQFHGYIMPLIEKRFHKFTEWVTRKIDMNLYEITQSCLMLVESFHQLHAKGLSYQDISYNNIMIDPKNGEILIIDNDNVTTNQESVNGVYGTAGFMAPEIVEERSMPNADTDRYSLAIFLFIFLMIGHPFHGVLELKIKCFDEIAAKRLYGDQAVFIFDPNRSENRPDPNEHRGVIKLWKMYPKFIKDLFIQTFTEGILNPSRRVRESEWKDAFVALESSLYHCTCGKELIYDQYDLMLTKKHKTCMCGLSIEPARIKMPNHILVIEDKKTIKNILFNKRIDFESSMDYALIKKNQSDYVLVNQFDESITKLSKNGLVEDIKVNQSSILKNDDILQIKGQKCYVRIPQTK